MARDWANPRGRDWLFRQLSTLPHSTLNHVGFDHVRVGIFMFIVCVCVPQWKQVIYHYILLLICTDEDYLHCIRNHYVKVQHITWLIHWHHRVSRRNTTFIFLPSGKYGAMKKFRKIYCFFPCFLSAFIEK